MELKLLTIFVMVFAVTEGKVVDLTHLLNDNKSLAWPGYDPFKLTVLQKEWYELAPGLEVWLEHNEFYTAEHYGTHIDAPGHFSNNDNNWKLDQIPVERFIGDAVVIDIMERANTDPDALVLLSDLLEWEDEHGQIKDGSIVLMNSGWSRYWGNRTQYFGSDEDVWSTFHFPGFSMEAIEWLLKNRVISAIGVDTISMDPGIGSVTFDVHRALLSENIYGIENMLDLHRIPASGARLYVFPMKIKGGSGAPTRVVAEFEHLDKTTTMMTTSGCVRQSHDFYMIFLLILWRSLLNCLSEGNN